MIRHAAKNLVAQAFQPVPKTPCFFLFHSNNVFHMVGEYFARFMDKGGLLALASGASFPNPSQKKRGKNHELSPLRVWFTTIM
jgi:hypothetical protein